MLAQAFAVITGGGTSGHVLPALAISDALVQRGHRIDEIVYVGAQRGIETRLVPPTGYPHHFLEVAGLQRSLTPKNLTFPFKMIGAVRAARSLLKQYRPAVVVSVGGYASFPATFAARLAHIPVVVVSYDRIPGLASKVSARFATACAVAFEGSRLPRARYTGAPVRASLVHLDRAASRDAARAALGIAQDRFLVAAFGGSLGAQSLNSAVSGLCDLMSERTDLAVRHVVGERFLKSAATERDGSSGMMYTVIGYENEMVSVYAAADLMVTRAGAGTIAELATVGMPAIVVPWSGAAEDHQTLNADVLGSVGAAVAISESDFNERRLADEVVRLIDDPDALALLSRRAYAAGEAHRSGRLIDLIEEVAVR